MKKQMRIERVCASEGFPFLCRVCEETHEDWDYLRIYLDNSIGGRCVHIRCLPPWLRQMLDLESESEKKPMTLEEIIIKVWEMAQTSVKQGNDPYNDNAVRQSTLKWASFELNERTEIAREAGVRKVAEYLKDEIATQETRSAGIPKLKAHLNAVEKTILQTVINTLEEWLAAAPTQRR